MAYTAEQISNAQAIMRVADSRGLGTNGEILGVMTAMTESGLVAVNYGDVQNGSMTSSRGLFQQQQQWGSLSVRLDPTGSAGLFYDAVQRVTGYQLFLASGNLPGLAQAVQQSEFSNGSNYLAQLGNATSLVAQINSGGGVGAAAGNPTPSGGGNGAIAAAAALTKVGGPYLWAGNGPTAFDCSGLTKWAWAQAGVDIPRTSFQQAGLPAIKQADLQPGDLITYYNPVSHVAIYVGDGMVVSAADAALGIIKAPIDYAGGGITTTYHRVPGFTGGGSGQGVAVPTFKTSGTTNDGMYTFTTQKVTLSGTAYTQETLTPTKTNPKPETILVDHPDSVDVTDHSQDVISMVLSVKDPKTGRITNTAGYSAVTITNPQWATIMLQFFGLGPLISEWNKYQTQFYDTPTDRGGGGGQTPGEAIASSVKDWVGNLVTTLTADAKLAALVALGAVVIGIAIFVFIKNGGAGTHVTRTSYGSTGLAETAMKTV